MTVSFELDAEHKDPVEAAGSYPLYEATAGTALDVLLAGRAVFPPAAPDPAITLRCAAALAAGAKALEAQTAEPFALYTPAQVAVFLRTADTAQRALRAASASALGHLEDLRRRGELGDDAQRAAGMLRDLEDTPALGAQLAEIAALAYRGYTDAGARDLLVAAVEEFERRAVPVLRVVIDKPGTWPALEFSYRRAAHGLRFSVVEGWECLVKKGKSWSTVPMAAAYTSCVHPCVLVDSALRAIDAHLDEPNDPDAARDLSALVEAFKTCGVSVLDYRFASRTGDARTEMNARIHISVAQQALRLEAVPGWQITYLGADRIAHHVPIRAGSKHPDPQARAAALAADVMAEAERLPAGWRSGPANGGRP